MTVNIRTTGLMDQTFFTFIIVKFLFQLQIKRSQIVNCLFTI